MTLDINYGGPDSEAKLAAAVQILAVALRTTIETMAKQNVGDDAWLNDLEQILIRQAKNTISEGIAIQTEAKILQFGVDVLQAQLSATRGGIILQE